MKQALAGIDIGGTKIAIALATTDGEIIAKRRLPTQNQNGPFAVLESVSQTLAEMLRESEASLAAIGVGSPAPLDAEKGLILSPSNLLDWDRFPIVEILRDKFGVPVLLDNDANAAALGEHSFGAGRGYNNVFYVTVSTGIGGGIVINGEIYHGVSTGAGEIGHTIVQPDGVRCNCGSVGCLETISSGTHIVRRVNERLAAGEPSIIRELTSDGTEMSVQVVVEAARRDDPLALKIWNETCRYLSIGIANAITLLAPEIVVVGGGVASAGDLLFVPLKKLVPEYVSMIPKDKINIVPAALGTESGLYGAIELAKKADSGPLATYASKTDKMDRRSFLTKLGTAAAALSLGRTAYPQMTPTQTRDEFLLYVGTYTSDTRSKGIYIYKFSTKDGGLLLYKTVENVVDPSFLAIDARNRYLYAVNETLEYEGKKSGAVTSFAIDQTSGDLTFLNKQPSLGGAPCHISISKDGRFAMVANYVGGNLSVFPIEPNGKLKPASDLEQHIGTGPNKERQESAHAHSINLDRNNRFAAACDLGTDKVFIYKFDEQKGKLTTNPSQPFFQTKPGAGPRHLAFHPNGNLAFVINELDSTVTSLAYDPARGTLKHVQTLSTLPPDWSGENSCAEIVVSPDGNFLYGSNRGHDTIVCYRIDQRTGKLDVIEQTSTGGKVPRNFTIDPTGHYLLAANQKSDNIVTFAIDRGTGKLKTTGSKADVPAPVCLKLIPAFR